MIEDNFTGTDMLKLCIYELLINTLILTVWIIIIIILILITMSNVDNYD